MDWRRPDFGRQEIDLVAGEPTMAFFLVTMTHPDGDGWGQHVVPTSTISVL